MGLKSENVEKVLVLQHFLKGQGSPGDFNRTNSGARRRGFGVILGSFWGLWDHFRYMKVALESLWSVFKIYTFSNGF